MLNLTWYNALNQPPFTPPAWIFAPAWTFLYVTIFIAFVIFAVKKTSKSKVWGYVLFFTQIFLNFAWTPIFFHLHKMVMALAIIVLMIITAFWNIIEFSKISNRAVNFLIPYILWLIFAVYLNFGFVILN